MFSLNATPSKITSFSPRAETHGNEKVPAADIKFETRAHSSILDPLDAGLRTFLFRKPAHPGEQQPLIEGDELTALARPSLKPMVLDEDWTGYTARIGNGLAEHVDIVLEDCTFTNVRIEAIEGGSVELAFSLQFHPTQEQAGRLAHLIQNTVELTLTPPEASRQASLAA